ncbi:MAG: rRNA pseudouridine synthase [Solobacterium sp.]|nr:rRNA pseudouridine synthase [Solobacterium sp.]
MERLQKVIANAGITSRRKAEELIEKGRVKVNGVVVKELGFKVDSKDEIEVDNKPIQKEEKVYYLLNKPKKTICSLKDEKGRATVIDCFPNIKERIFPVGRLDYDTTGVLILTNDGDFANQMMHPRHHIPKTYEVSIDGYLTDAQIKALEKGIPLEDGKTQPAIVNLLNRSQKKNKSILELTIFEGKNREIKRMMEYFHHTVTRLNRLSYGSLTLGKLRQGEYRKLRNYEIRQLLSQVKEASKG